MKTKLLLFLLGASVSLNGWSQSVTITSDLTTATQVGNVLTVDYTYTDNTSTENYIFCGINLLDDWDYVSYVGGEGINPLPKGTNVTGTFNITIPSNTTPTADLIGNLNYKINIAIREVSGDVYITGDFPATQLNFTAAPLSIKESELLNNVNVFYLKNRIHIKGLNNSDKYELKIYDLLGREVQKIINDNNYVNLSPSIYVAKLKVDGKGTMTSKFLVN
jgi:hypothetical protein